jgi:hypothetical protein
MGVCLSGGDQTAYSVLKQSIIGSLLTNEQELQAFYKCCTIETHTLKSILPINQLQSFFIVISGEVAVCLTPRDGKSVIVTTYGPGEMIYFFQSTSISCSGGSIVNPTMGLRLNLQFRSSSIDLKTRAQVIGIDRASIDRFLDKYPSSLGLKRLFGLKLEDFLEFPAFTSLTPEQVSRHK